MSVLAGLEPKEVFHYFEEISNIPRPSYKEGENQQLSGKLRKGTELRILSG